MAETKKRLIIIDGNALIHRSFHALPPLATRSGEIVNAVFGFTSVLLKAIREFKPNYIALTLDRKEKTFRHEEYKEYKATRVKAAQELYDQIPRVKEVAGTLGIPIYELAGFEADDLIGTIANSVNGNIEKIIVTGDLDTLQLVNPHTKVYTMKRGLTDSMLYDEKCVKERYGLKPSQMIDFKALRGDPSDNIPGVKGIGEITAIELLKNFKSLDGVYKNINSDKIKDRIRELLKEHKESAYMSKSLATIRLDAGIKFKLDEAKFGNFSQEAAATLFSELEFRTLLPKLYEISNGLKTGSESREEKEERITNKFERNLKKFKYHLVNDDKSFNDFFKKIKKQKEFTFDTETTGANPFSADLLGISFSWQAGEAYYVNVKGQMSKVKGNNLFNYNKTSLGNDWTQKLKPVFEDEKIKKSGHNLKFDIEVMSKTGIDVKGIDTDTMIASYLLNPGSRQHGLDGLTFAEFNHQKITKDDLLGKGKQRITFSDIPLDRLYNYSCEDADFTWRLARKLLPELKKEKLEKLFDEIEMPLVKVLSEMELEGVKIDTIYLNKLKKETVKKIEALEKKIYKEAGEEFNINSTQQLRDVLFVKLGLSTAGISKTKTGFSTGADELEKLKNEHEIIRLIQEYRELTKLLSTYIDALPKLVNKETGRLHTSFNQSVTATGRLSSTEPNLQNIPIRTELGREIRQAFVARTGYKLLSLDYSQIELRLAAHFSKDPKMISAFKNGADIHRATAAEINQIKPEEVGSDVRRQAKAVNFGILYGQGPHGLSQSADIPYMRAKEFIDKYFSVYKNVKKWIDKTIADAHKKEYVETLFGRRRYMPEINSTTLMISKAAERTAVNTPLQGTAADMIKVAMNKISEYIKKEKLDKEIKMLLQVHDELLFEIKNGSDPRIVDNIKNLMENVIELEIPIVVDAKIGNNWAQMSKIK